MSFGLFRFGLLSGDERIFCGGYRAVFVITVDFSPSIQEKRSVSTIAVRFGRGRQFKSRIIAADIRNDAVAKFVAILAALRQIRTDQRSLLGRNLILRSRSQFSKILWEPAERSVVGLY